MVISAKPNYTTQTSNHTGGFVFFHSSVYNCTSYTHLSSSLLFQFLITKCSRCIESINIKKLFMHGRHCLFTHLACTLDCRRCKSRLFRLGTCCCCCCLRRYDSLSATDNSHWHTCDQDNLSRDVPLRINGGA